MAYTEKQILEFYRRIGRAIVKLDSVYGFRHTTQSADDAFRKLKKLVEEIDASDKEITSPPDSSPRR